MPEESTKKPNKHIRGGLVCWIFFFNPVDSGESLKVLECESDMMKVVFWDKFKGG